MRVTILFFAAARDLVGSEKIEHELPAGSTVGHLKRTLAAEFPPLESLLRHSMIAVGTEYAADAVALSDGAEVAIIPPVSGG